MGRVSSIEKGNTGKELYGALGRLAGGIPSSSVEQRMQQMLQFGVLWPFSLGESSDFWLRVMEQEGLQGPAGYRGLFPVTLGFNEEFKSGVNDTENSQLFVSDVVRLLGRRFMNSYYFDEGTGRLEQKNLSRGLVLLNIPVGNLHRTVVIDYLKDDFISVLLPSGFSDDESYNDWLESVVNSGIRSIGDLDNYDVRDVVLRVVVGDKGTTFDNVAKKVDELPDPDIPATVCLMRDDDGGFSGFHFSFAHAAVDGYPAFEHVIDDLFGELVDRYGVKGRDRASGGGVENPRYGIHVDALHYTVSDSDENGIHNNNFPRKFPVEVRVSVPFGDVFSYVSEVSKKLAELIGEERVSSFFVLLMATALTSGHSVMFPVAPNESGMNVSRLSMSILGPVLYESVNKLIESRDVSGLRRAYRQFVDELDAAKRGYGTVTTIGGVLPNDRVRRALENLSVKALPSLGNALLASNVQISSLGSVGQFPNIERCTDRVRFFSAGSRGVDFAIGIFGDEASGRFFVDDIQIFMFLKQFVNSFKEQVGPRVSFRSYFLDIYATKMSAEEQRLLNNLVFNSRMYDTLGEIRRDVNERSRYRRVCKKFILQFFARVSADVYVEDVYSEFIESIGERYKNMFLEWIRGIYKIGKAMGVDGVDPFQVGNG